MPNRCVVGGCSNITDKEKGISLHLIPFSGDERQEAKKRRKQWVDFVRLKRAKWNPTKYSSICSAHFSREDFSEMFYDISGKKPRLISDEIGVLAIPRSAVVTEEKPISARAKRTLLKDAMQSSKSSHPDTSATVGDGLREQEASIIVNINAALENEREENFDQIDQHFVSSKGMHGCNSRSVVNVYTNTSGCVGCAYLVKERRKTWNKYIALKEKYDALIKIKRSKGVQCNILMEGNESEHVNCEQEMPMVMDMDYQDDKDTVDNSETVDDGTDDCVTNAESEEEFVPDTESESEDNANRSYVGEENLRIEPKFIVFLSQLLILFKFCHFCKTDHPLIEIKTDGSAVIIESSCINPTCTKRLNVWRSQPLMPRSKINAGDFLLSFSILLSGGSPAKVIRMFKHMGLGGISLETYYRHQHNYHFPTVLIHWEDYQGQILTRLKELESSLVISGDGRHDSMGHCAKYGAYTIFSCTTQEIIHFSLVQRNEVNSSPAMEYEGFKRSMNFLSNKGLSIATFVSDRHQTIAKHMREQLPEIQHYFDLWHLQKKLRKILTKLAKEADCAELSKWVQPCINHLHWSSSSTHSGNGRIILAKFMSFLSHIIDKHDNLDNPLFNKCAHGEITPRKWLLPESPAFIKLSNAFQNKSLVKGIMNASPLDQTSCLEGFHSVLNQFSPKMNAYSYAGIFCRHILAAIHFNFNLNRKAREGRNGIQIKVTYPKFKDGEATVRDLKEKQNFDYVGQLYQTFLSASKDTLQQARNKLEGMTPAPMNSMLNKEPKIAAIEKHNSRKNLTVQDVPPTTPISVVLAREKAKKSRKRALPRCKECHNLIKGHKNVKDCPRNDLMI